MAKGSLFILCASAVLLAGGGFFYPESNTDSHAVPKIHAKISAPALAPADAFSVKPIVAQQPAYIPQSALPQQASPAQVPVEGADARLTEAPSREPASMAEAEEMMAAVTAASEGSLAAEVRAFERSPQYLSIARPDNANVSLEQILQAVESGSQGRSQGGDIFTSPFGGAR